MQYVQNPDGTVNTMEEYKENIKAVKEGRDCKDSEVKVAPYNQLGVTEKIRVNNFMKKHPELTTSEKRAEYFKNLAAKELIEVRNENNSRVATGKAPLTSQDYELSMPKEGVITSAWRAKRDRDTAIETMKSNNSMYNDALGNGSREF